jgi:hypothetical protein
VDVWHELWDILQYALVVVPILGGLAGYFKAKRGETTIQLLEIENASLRRQLGDLGETSPALQKLTAKVDEIIQLMKERK